jgi:Leucine-rich repeat (LRR) protein
LELENNELTGTLPAILWDLDQLKTLRLENNRFSGSLSTYIGNLVNLRVLSIAETGLSGTLPSELSNLKHLELATFQHNGFSGTVTEALCDQLPRLQALEADCLYGNIDCACCTLCCPAGKTDPTKCEAQ